jgi:hypothetical protein
MAFATPSTFPVLSSCLQRLYIVRGGHAMPHDDLCRSALKASIGPERRVDTDRRSLILALGMFAMGADNFVVAGILPGIAASLHTSVSVAGQMMPYARSCFGSDCLGMDLQLKQHLSWWLPNGLHGLI